MDNALEPTPLFTLNLPSHISKQSLQHVHPLEIVYQPRILSLALLQQVIFVQYCFERHVLLIEQAVDGGTVVKPESVAKAPPKLSNQVQRRCMLDYLQNMKSRMRVGEVAVGEEH